MGSYTTTRQPKRRRHWVSSTLTVRQRSGRRGPRRQAALGLKSSRRIERISSEHRLWRSSDTGLRASEHIGSSRRNRHCWRKQAQCKMRFAILSSAFGILWRSRRPSRRAMRCLSFKESSRSCAQSWQRPTRSRQRSRKCFLLKRKSFVCKSPGGTKSARQLRPLCAQKTRNGKKRPRWRKSARV